ncbi:MAG TPA: zinc-binding alcohol dehydrogenase family protein [Thermoplasmata archaeon]|nr:zinc-binding alcohol dehydrogenase family protein [Thermoplasmata archaeon]
MKAAVLHAFGEPPRYEEFPEPAFGPDEVRLEVRASPLTRLVRGIASGRHYASPRSLPAVMGVEGVGRLEDGRRVYADAVRAPYGLLAERAAVVPARCLPIPDGLDEAVAAGIANPGLSSWLALSYRAKIQPGESVLVLGATGVSGRLALPIAKHLGASRVVATGRNPTALAALTELGADAVVSLAQPDAALAESLRRAQGDHPYDIVLDYVWGHPAEVVLPMFTGRGMVDRVPRTRYVAIGEMAGGTISIGSQPFRSSGLELLGSGIGSAPRAASAESLPQIWSLARQGRLPLDLERVPLAEVEGTWDLPTPVGRRRIYVM